ncbi:MAG TPA: response regulator [Chryseosolibacter sp.]|nr:response regulator [Chryseosolibacter sp.]
MTVFIIDDDGDDTAIFCEALRDVAPDTFCLVAHSGESALRQLVEATSIPEFIFLDANMTTMSGKECLIALRSIQRLAGVKIIIYSGSVTEVMKQEFKSLGAYDSFAKPSSFYDLCDRLKKYLQKEA